MTDKGITIRVIVTHGWKKGTGVWKLVAKDRRQRRSCEVKHDSEDTMRWACLLVLIEVSGYKE